MKIFFCCTMTAVFLFTGVLPRLYADSALTVPQAGGQDDGRFFSDEPAAPHNKALDLLELSGMFAGTYLACRSDIMAEDISGYSGSQLFSKAEKSGIALLTAFAGTILGGVTAAVAFGPISPDYMKENNFNDGTKVLMAGFGAAAMAAGGYAGYRLGGNSPDKYGEEIIAGSIVGAVIGSYFGNFLGDLIFPDNGKKKAGVQ
jgi:hypothetical protein